MAPKANQGGIEMWPSFETASWLFDRANIVLIGAAAFGVAATILLVWMGNVKEAYLRKDLATTRERTELLERDSELLRKENLRLEAELAVAPVFWTEG